MANPVGPTPIDLQALRRAPKVLLHDHLDGGLRPATVNLDLGEPVSVQRPTVTLVDVDWTDVHPPETFSFVECTVTRDGAAVDGLVYHPHPETKPMHHQPSTVVELLLPHLPGLTPGETLTLQVDPRQAVLTDR